MAVVRALPVPLVEAPTSAAVPTAFLREAPCGFAEDEKESWNKPSLEFLPSESECIQILKFSDSEKLRVP